MLTLKTSSFLVNANTKIIFVRPLYSVLFVCGRVFSPSLLVLAKPQDSGLSCFSRLGLHTRLVVAAGVRRRAAFSSAAPFAWSSLIIMSAACRAAFPRHTPSLSANSEPLLALGCAFSGKRKSSKVAAWGGGYSLVVKDGAYLRRAFLQTADITITRPDGGRRQHAC